MCPNRPESAGPGAQSGSGVSGARGWVPPGAPAGGREGPAGLRPHPALPAGAPASFRPLPPASPAARTGTRLRAAGVDRKPLGTALPPGGLPCPLPALHPVGSSSFSSSGKLFLTSPLLATQSSQCRLSVAHGDAPRDSCKPHEEYYTRGLRVRPWLLLMTTILYVKVASDTY